MSISSVFTREVPAIAAIGFLWSRVASRSRRRAFLPAQDERDNALRPPAAQSSQQDAC